MRVNRYDIRIGYIPFWQVCPYTATVDYGNIGARHTAAGICAEVAYRHLTVSYHTDPFFIGDRERYVARCDDLFQDIGAVILCFLHSRLGFTVFFAKVGDKPGADISVGSNDHLPYCVQLRSRGGKQDGVSFFVPYHAGGNGFVRMTVKHCVNADRVLYQAGGGRRTASLFIAEMCKNDHVICALFLAGVDILLDLRIERLLALAIKAVDKIPVLHKA